MMPRAAGRISWWEYLTRKPAYPFPLTAYQGSQIAFGGRGVFKGLALTNPNASAGTLAVYDGSDANGTPVYDQAFTASGNLIFGPSSNGILMRAGMFIVVSGGQLSGAIFASYFTPEEEPWYFGLGPRDRDWLNVIPGESPFHGDGADWQHPGGPGSPGHDHAGQARPVD